MTKQMVVPVIVTLFCLFLAWLNIWMFFRAWHNKRVASEPNLIQHYHTKENGCIRVYNRGAGKVEAKIDKIPAGGNLEIKVPIELPPDADCGGKQGKPI